MSRSRRCARPRATPRGTNETSPARLHIARAYIHPTLTKGADVPTQDTDTREQAQELTCETCKGSRYIKSDSEWPGPSEDPCPDCNDGPCSGCDAPASTCIICDAEYCEECWPEHGCDENDLLAWSIGDREAGPS